MVRLEVITGPMFSGKTEELIRLIKRAKISGKRILILRPQEDDRTEELGVLRESNKYAIEGVFKDETFRVQSRQEAEDLIKKFQPEVMGVDEAQLFGGWMFDLIREILIEKKWQDIEIIAAGLDTDAWMMPFGIMPNLLALADSIRKETAICDSCKGKMGPAILTQKVGGSRERVEIGGKGIYEARCRVCHTIPPQPLQ